MRIDATSYDQAIACIQNWATRGESRYLTEVAVHMVMESRMSRDNWIAVENADLVTPGGMPLVWMLRMMGYPQQPRVYGPELMLRTCQMAAQNGIPVGLLSSTTDVLGRLSDRLTDRFPRLQITYACAPPLPPRAEPKDAETVLAIVESDCRILFVGLGCPRQERWMAAHRGRVPCVMLGVGAAFDFNSGTKPQAPGLLQRVGLEWLFRLVTEPRRLWFRYLYHNPRFAVLAIGSLIRYRHERRLGARTESH